MTLRFLKDAFPFESVPIFVPQGFGPAALPGNCDMWGPQSSRAHRCLTPSVSAAASSIHCMLTEAFSEVIEGIQQNTFTEQPDDNWLTTELVEMSNSGRVL